MQLSSKTANRCLQRWPATPRATDRWCPQNKNYRPAMWCLLVPANGGLRDSFVLPTGGALQKLPTVWHLQKLPTDGAFKNYRPVVPFKKYQQGRRGGEGGGDAVPPPHFHAGPPGKTTTAPSAKYAATTFLRTSAFPSRRFSVVLETEVHSSPCAGSADTHLAPIINQ